MIELSSLIKRGSDRCGSRKLDTLSELVVPVEELELAYSLVRARKPLLVLDTNAGSGLLAAAVACALEKNGRGALWAFARNDEVGGARELWSSLDLHGRIQLHTDPLAEFLGKYNGVAFDLVFAGGATRDLDVAQITELGLLEGPLVLCGARGPDAYAQPESVALSPTLRVSHVTRDRRADAATLETAKDQPEPTQKKPFSVAMLQGLTPERVQESVDFSRFDGVAREFLPKGHVAYLNDPAGREPYNLLAFLSSLVRDESILDVGTLHGNSALALSYGANHVVSFDVERVHRFPERWGTIDFVRGDVLAPGPARQRFLSAIPRTRLVSLDVDPHDGEKERRFLALLEEVQFRGCLVLDDIHLNAEMNRFWDSIARPKVDVTACGHTTGTGCVLFADAES